MPLKIFVAMPCAQGFVRMQAASTMAAASAALVGAGFDVIIETLELAEITAARNYLASKALASGVAKLFFIDSDMSFSPQVTLRLVSASKDVIGAGAPRRKLSLENVIALARANPDRSPSKLLSSALTYNLRRLDPTYSFVDGIAEVDGIGMAATLIDVSVLRSMVDAGAAKPRHPTNDGFQIYGFFDAVEQEGVTLSEDYSFCARWRGLGGKVHAIDSVGVGHVGNFVYEGSFIEAMSPD